MILSKNSHVLFYGDSITDCGRNRDDLNSLGSGYAFLVAGRLQSAYPGWNLKFTNKGLSGNRVFDLEERLEKDVLALKPDVVSILIGVNDTWRRYDSNLISKIDEFQASYDRILARITGELTSRVVLMEPFLLPVPEERKKWREDLDPRITAVRELAWKYRLPYIALDGIFATAATMAPADYWLPDGVHPSVAGHGLIASAWIRAIKN